MASGYTDHYVHYDYVKVLKKLKRRGYRLERVLIVDDTPHEAKRNYGNSIYPGEYLGQPDDDELPQCCSSACPPNFFVNPSPKRPLQAEDFRLSIVRLRRASGVAPEL